MRFVDENIDFFSNVCLFSADPIYDEEKFLIKIRKRSHTPILMGVKKLQTPFKVPWLENKTMEIVWTA